MSIFLTKSGFYSKFSKMIDKVTFEDSCSTEVILFLEKNLKFIIRKKISILELIFYTRLPQKVKSPNFIKIIESVLIFIKENNINESLSDEVRHNEIAQPLLLQFFYWGGNDQINENLISLLKKEMDFSNAFCNEILEMVQGLEISQNYFCENPGKLMWDFNICLDLFKKSFGNQLILSPENHNYIKFGTL